MSEKLPFGVYKALENGIATMLKNLERSLEKTESGRSDFSEYIPGNC